MRKKILTSAILILTIAFMSSCSSDDSSNPDPNNPNPENPDKGGDDENPGDKTDPKTYQYKQKVLVEDITSASCVWCPLATIATEELDKSDFADKIISVAVHGDFDIRNVKDPFVLPDMKNLMSALKLKGWPFVAWNRNTSIEGTEFQNFIPETAFGVYTFTPKLFDNFQKKYNLFKDSSPIGIKIESDLSTSDGQVDISLKFGKDLNQELKYVVYLIEDGLVFQQAKHLRLFGEQGNGGKWEMDFVHNQVVRATNNFLGESIPAGESVTTNEFKVSTNLTYTIENLDNTSVVVAILDTNGNVLNAQIAKANITQDYETVE